MARHRSAVEAVAPDDEAAVAGEVDLGRDLVVLVAEVALQPPEVDVVVVEGFLGSVDGVGRQVDVHVRPLVGVEVLDAGVAAPVGVPQQDQRSGRAVVEGDEHGRHRCRRHGGRRHGGRWHGGRRRDRGLDHWFRRHCRRDRRLGGLGRRLGRLGWLVSGDDRGGAERRGVVDGLVDEQLPWLEQSQPDGDRDDQRRADRHDPDPAAAPGLVAARKVNGLTHADSCRSAGGGELEGDSAAGWLFDPDPAAVGFHEAVGDRQPETGATRGAAAARVGTGEAFEGLG